MAGLFFKRAALGAAGAVLGFLCMAAVPTAPDAPNLVRNSDFKTRAANGPADYQLSGDVAYQYLGNPKKEVAGWGIALQSAKRPGSAGSVSQTVGGIDPAAGRWYRFSFRGLPQEHFAVHNNNLYIRVDFLGANQTAYGAKEYKMYSVVEQARRDLTPNGNHHRHGAEVWQTYEVAFWLPFPQINALRLTVGFGDGAATGRQSADFYLTDFKLVRLAALAPDPKSTVAQPVAIDPKEKLLPLGGRWFYLPRPGETKAPARFDADNADRLYYYDGQYSTPFAGNMSSWLHPGNVDENGNTVQSDRPVKDNVVVTFDSTDLIIRTRGLPNHPTTKFPNTNYQDDDFDPSPIRERTHTYYIPLNPKENPAHIVVTHNNSNRALNMGPIGVAYNGVVFFNPFDANMQDASNIMDKCCGHTAPDGQYHYHKYPICINTPWADEGKEHSPLLGWMFDGYPIYGPYESAGVMAKDVKGEHALNGFNMHYDKDRGWHYHVTPGQFPYLIGGYWGTKDPRDMQGQGPPGGRAGMGQGRGPGGRGQGMGPGGRSGGGPERGRGPNPGHRPPPPGF